MDKSELLDSLHSFGQHLVSSRDASADDMATGLGMALLALAELLKAEPQSVGHVDSAPDERMGFKAKANRW